MATATYEPIATTTLNSTASITFSGIAATWTDLRIVINAEQASMNGLWIRFNSDTATNYSMTGMYGDGSSALSERQTSVTYGKCAFSVGYTGIPSNHIIDIFNYAGSTYKTTLATGSLNYPAANLGYVWREVILWRSTSAITSITLSAQTVGLDSGTTATLYGIKAA